MDEAMIEILFNVEFFLKSFPPFSWKLRGRIKVFAHSALQRSIRTSRSSNNIQPKEAFNLSQHFIVGSPQNFPFGGPIFSKSTFEDNFNTLISKLNNCYNGHNMETDASHRTGWLPLMQLHMWPPHSHGCPSDHHRDKIICQDLCGTLWLIEKKCAPLTGNVLT